ncbi:DUF624 domain-containing protein [Arcanobacterium phocae]|uniref:Uncharacterized protein n=1 Tax=Arcanobacterium phocae TaxID=131112 RepID=A0A1H2LIB6_9ACTO|nr:DUF624 domain-containing protein [Arcanobacterium phocae]SDU80311.1 Protein of unknown function, DUF624 [Arcanobacterium phocae]
MNPNSAIYRVLDALANLIIINLLIIICSLPLITVGFALRAGYQGIADISNDSDARIVRTFIARLRRRWDATTTWGIILVIAIVLSVFEWFVLGQGVVLQSDQLSVAVLFIMKAGILCGVLILCSLTLSIYSLPLPANEKIGLIDMLTQALIKIAHCPARSIVAVAIAWAPVLLLFAVPTQWGAVVGYYLLVGFALPGYVFVLPVSQE